MPESTPPLNLLKQQQKLYNAASSLKLAFEELDEACLDIDNEKVKAKMQKYIAVVGVVSDSLSSLAKSSGEID